MGKNKTIIRSTTVVCVRDDKSVVIASDGQVTLGTAVIKSNANKIRTFHNDQIIVGFAGSTAKLQYWDSATNPQQAYNIYKQGATNLSLFDKYKVVISMYNDGEESGSITI